MIKILNMQYYALVHPDQKSPYLYKPESLGDNWEDLSKIKQESYRNLYIKLIWQKLQFNKSPIRNFTVWDKKSTRKSCKKLIMSQVKDSLNFRTRIQNANKRCDFLRLHLNLSFYHNSLPFLSFYNIIDEVSIFVDFDTFNYRVLHLNGYNSYHEKVLNFKPKKSRI